MSIKTEIETKIRLRVKFEEFVILEDVQFISRIIEIILFDILTGAHSQLCLSKSGDQKSKIKN